MLFGGGSAGSKPMSGRIYSTKGLNVPPGNRDKAAAASKPATTSSNKLVRWWCVVDGIMCVRVERRTGGRVGG
jgi:hypothetical protein